MLRVEAHRFLAEHRRESEQHVAPTQEKPHGHQIRSFGAPLCRHCAAAGNGLPGDSEGYERVEHNCLNVGSGAQFSLVGLLRGTDDSGNCATTLLVLNSDSFETVMYPLALNGWKSPTFALRPGSIAIDAAVGDSCRSTDQRRVARPQDGDGNGTAICDIGAFEVIAP
ncbi:choice-of-anchor Q domain-containing protein [Nevskia ramosa]|uniref:choice-of-anchor Q domain-containing protein n=1 Tax=Nevskia ramosa TaxID=64002 RepID=UPI0003B53656|nr:choice-of-anchor Q domain-containing protein [Nevskia ramosa]